MEPSKPFKDYYKILGIDEFHASPAEVERAFRQQSGVIRPDVNLDLETRAKFADLQEARGTLLDPLEKVLYHQDYTAHYFGQMFETLRAGLDKAAERTQRSLQQG